MAKKFFRVIKDSFIGLELIKVEDTPNRIVEIETDPKQGGMIPGDNLEEVADSEGTPLKKSAKKAEEKNEDLT